MHRDSFKPSDLTIVKRAGPSTLFPLGTFVRLRSGGPVGVIEGLSGDDHATVLWLSGNRSTLPDVCLEACGCVKDTIPKKVWASVA
jgi:hypothetical protein